MQRTEIGNYLYSTRMGRKEENIKDYLYKYNLEISESYYREIESGRKILSLDKAKSLCNSLQLEKEVFFYYFLKDILPEEIFVKLVREPAITEQSYNSASEGIASTKRELEMYRNAFMNKLVKQAYHPDDGVINFLYDNMQYLPLVHYIYMRNSCTFDEIGELSRRNEIEGSQEEILEIIDSRKLAYVDYDNRTVQGFGGEFECPQNKIGHALKNKFLQYEIEKTVREREHENSHQNNIKIDKDSSYIFAGLTCIDMDKNKEMFERNIANMVACFNSAVEPLENENSLPYFLGLVVSPRTEYDTK